MKNIFKYVLSLIIFFIATNISCSQETVYTSAEIMPQYPGGENEMMKYFTTIKYPKISVENSINSRVIARFIITKEGKIRNIEILKSLNKEFDTEFVKFIQAMPDWIPAKQNGQNVSCYYTIPMTIHFQR